MSVGFLRHCLLVGVLLVVAKPAWSQDLEPRRWTHLPTGLNVLGAGYSLTEGDIFLDPVLKAEDVEFRLHGVALGYMRSFGLFGRSARMDVSVPYARVRYEGLVDGVDTSTRRSGFGDPRLRLSVLLYGGPAQDRETFLTAPKSNTVVGAALAVSLPWGDYRADKLLNISGNQLIVRPQLGVTHTRGHWTFELSGSLWFFGDNDRFDQDRTLEKDTLWSAQAHVIYSFRPGLWVSVSAARGAGAEVTLDDRLTTNRIDAGLWALNLGLPINRAQGLKFSYVRYRNHESIGFDSDALVTAWTLLF